MADYITDFQTNYTASSVLYEGDPDLEKINNIIDCRKGRSGLEFLIDWETGPQTWEVEANVSTDVVKEYMILNSRCRSYIKSDQYNSTKKKSDCYKQFANDWFCTTVTSSNFKDPTVLILDGEDFNTTRRLLSVQRMKIHIPNNRSAIFMKQDMLTDQSILDHVFLYNTSVQDFIVTYRKTLKLNAIWLDYTGTLSGGISPAWIEIKTLFRNHITGAIFALTWFTARNSEPLSQIEVIIKTQRYMSRYVYSSTLLCTDQIIQCTDHTTRELICDQGVFNYYPMSMIVFRVTSSFFS